jgi:hypothetical protein
VGTDSVIRVYDSGIKYNFLRPRQSIVISRDDIIFWICCCFIHQHSTNLHLHDTFSIVWKRIFLPKYRKYTIKYKKNFVYKIFKNLSCLFSLVFSRAQAFVPSSNWSLHLWFSLTVQLLLRGSVGEKGIKACRKHKVVPTDAARLIEQLLKCITMQARI